MKTIFMTRAQHEAWDKALRSGGYRQGKYTLREQREGVYFYCCLGVLQAVLGGDTHDDSGNSFLSYRWLNETGIRFVDTSETTIKVSGTHLEPFLTPLGMSAATANDGDKYDFIDIADAIAECVEYIEPKAPDAVLENNDKE